MKQHPSEVARELKRALQDCYPDTRWSVRVRESGRYNKIEVRWSGEPQRRDVDAIASGYVRPDWAGGGIDWIESRHQDAGT